MALYYNNTHGVAKTHVADAHVVADAHIANVHIANVHVADAHVVTNTHVVETHGRASLRPRASLLPVEIETYYGDPIRQTVTARIADAHVANVSVVNAHVVTGAYVAGMSVVNAHVVTDTHVVETHGRRDARPCVSTDQGNRNVLRRNDSSNGNNAPCIPTNRGNRNVSR